MRVTTILRSLFATAVAITATSTQTTATTTTTAPCVSLQIETTGTGTTTGTVPATGTATPIQDGTIATAVVKLDPAFAANPPSEVTVSAPGLQCGRTTFAFTKGDPSTYEQRVTCRTTAGSAPAVDGTLVDVPVTLTYKNGPRQSDSQKIKRRVRSSGRCSGYGDPHLTTLDGVAYDFQKQGVFKYFESDKFQVQVFQEKCGPVAQLKDAAPSCYQGVAVAFGASVARFFIADGKIQVGKGSPSLQWLSIEKLGGAADGYRVFTNVDQATYVDINLDKWATYNNYPYLNVALQVSPYFKSGPVSGLMGNWNGNRNDDVTNNDQLAQTHGVSLRDNLFTCVNDACADKLKAGSLQDSNALSLPSTQALLHQGYVAVASDAVVLRAFTPVLKAPTLKRRQLGDYTAGQVQVQAGGSNGAGVAAAAATTTNATTMSPTTTTTTTTTTAAVVTTTAPPSVPMVKDVSVRASQLCKQVISTLAATCGKYVRDTDTFIATSCVADAVLLGDLSVVDSAKLGYLRECRRELDARLSTQTACASETKTLKRDRASLFFGDLSRCAKKCSGRGQCLAAGCKCNVGFTGLGCDVAI